MSEGSNTFPPTQLRITWKANMDSDSSTDDDCQVIRAVSFVKCCFGYLKMFCKTFFSLLKITGVTYLKPGTKRSGKIEVSALHFPAKGTIPCIFVSQERQNRLHLYSSDIKAYSIYMRIMYLPTSFRAKCVRFLSCNDQDFGNRPSDFRRFPTIFRRLPNSVEKYPKKLPSTFEYLRR